MFNFNKYVDIMSTEDVEQVNIYNTIIVFFYFTFVIFDLALSFQTNIILLCYSILFILCMNYNKRYSLQYTCKLSYPDAKS